MKIILLFLMCTPIVSMATLESRYHINSRVQATENPATLLEVGEAVSTKTAVYFGSLIPSQAKFGLDDSIKMNMTYISARADYFYNGAFEQGFYNGVALTYTEAQYRSESLIDLDRKIGGMGIGVQIGYVGNLGDFTIGTSLRGHYYSFKTEQKDTRSSATKLLVVPHHEGFSGSVDLGYKF